MAALTQAEKDELFAKLMTKYSNVWEPLPNIVKSDVQTGITNVDGWMEDNKTSYNNSLPNKLKNNFTDTQKAVFLAEVALKKGEVA